MPTENRSSNTELSKIVTEALVGMVSGVTGMKPPPGEPLPGFIQAPIDRAVTRISGLLAQPAPQPHAEPDSYPPCDYCGITPDYHPWHGSGMLNGVENRHIHACDGCRGQLPLHPGQPHPEPIAWMVGTAFWWTKEEAERDAAATGLPIVGLGPMTGSAEVEQLRDVVKHSDNQIMRQSLRISNQRAQLLERDALLREKSGDLIRMAAHLISAPLIALQDLQYEDKKMTRARVDKAVDTADARLKDAAYELRRIADALSASAEPSAPATKYPNRLCHIDYTAHPYRCGCLRGDEESQRIYDEHCRSAEPEAKS